MSHSDLDDVAVTNFREYIQIPSLSTTTDYVDCVEFLRKQANDIGLTFDVIQLLPKRPVVLIKWPGLEPDLPCILVNSHMDVVPAEEDKWTHPPFSAHVDEEGRIYGRGTQDTKIIGVQYLEAIRRMKLKGVRLLRTLVVTFVPDEEVGGQEGMKLFVETPEFGALKIAIALDEGCANQQPGTYYLFNGEKHKWGLRFHVNGDVGHGSLMLANTAGEKLATLLRTLYDFRAAEIGRAEDRWCADVVSVNVTMVEGGQQDNVIPSEYVVTTDFRLPPNVDVKQWRKLVESWCKDAGPGVWTEELVCEVLDKPTEYKTNAFYKSMVDALKSAGYEHDTRILIGVTDIRYFRHLGIPSFGFTPLTGEVLAHQHDEHVGKEQFLHGIGVYGKIFANLGNLPNN